MSQEFNCVCAFCNRQNDMVSDPTEPDADPADGDLSLCFNCGEIMVIDLASQTKTRKPTDADYETIAADERVKMMRAAWVAYKEEREKDEPHVDMLTIQFAPIRDGFVRHAKTPYRDEDIERVKTMFALGALSVLKVLSVDMTAEAQARVIGEYYESVTDYLHHHPYVKRPEAKG